MESLPFVLNACLRSLFRLYEGGLMMNEEIVTCFLGNVYKNMYLCSIETIMRRCRFMLLCQTRTD